MKFSAATLLAAATLGLAAPAPQQDASNSDFIYQLQAAAQNNNFNQQLFTDGTNIYYGPNTQNVAAQGQPLVAINVFMDSNGNLKSSDNQNQYLSVGDNGRMQMSDRNQRGRWNMNRQSNDDVSLRFNNEQKFLACPVQNYGNNRNYNGRSRSNSRSRNKREEDKSETAAARNDWNNNNNYWNSNNNNWNQQQNNGVFQVYVNNAPCDNPVELFLNGQKQGRRNNQNYRNDRYDRNGRNYARDESSAESADATIVLRVNGMTRQNAMYSPVFNQDGRMYTQMQRDDHQFANRYGNDMFRMSQDGQIIDTRSQQYAQLGQNQQLTMANNQNQGLLFTVDVNGNLQYNGNQFLACDAGNNGLYEVRPAGAEGAAASCTNAQAIVIQIDRQ
ncbi:hypothetical protein CJU90_5579 [Yarrowia sp. C11]|nr:hypothetical protein CJU90_5579 [Yarrowia sp. C11]KAG5364163.1 hypothetical protein CKK34_2956 [Yarrowia sp. E02]